MTTPQPIFRTRALAMVLCCACLCFAGCGGGASTFGTSTGTAQTALLMTDTPPTGITVLAFEVTLTSVVLNPGGQVLLAAPTTVEVTRLQTDTMLLSSANIAPGTYTSAGITFGSASITFRNDTGSTMTVGGVSCPTGQICTASPVISSLSGSINLPGSGVTLTAGNTSALLLDLNLSSALSNTLGADLIGGSTITPVISSAGSFASLDDTVGVITTVNTTSNTVTMINAAGSFTMGIAGGLTPTIFSNFPGSCVTPGINCLAVGQIVAANVSLLANGTLSASNIYFQDQNNSVPEVEGLVVATSGLTPPAQFQMVVLQETPAVSGLDIGSVVNVALNTSPATTFDVDNLGALAVTSNYSFQNAADIIVGQQLQLQNLSFSSGLIRAGRIRLRSSRFTANVALTLFPNFDVNGLPALFGDSGVSQIQVDTGSFTAVGGAVQAVDQIATNSLVSIRAQLFANGSTPVAAATKVVEH